MSAKKPTYEELARRVAALESALEESQGKRRRAGRPAERAPAEPPDRQVEETLLHFLDFATDGFILLDSDLRIIRVSESSARDVGRTPLEVIGKELREVYADVEPSGRYGKYAEVLRTGKPFACDAVFQTEHGEKHVDLRAFKAGDGLGIIAVDVTAHQEAEAALRESERRYALAQRAAHIGSWEWDLRTRRGTWSEELEHIAGLEPGGFGGTPEDLARRIHPDDVERATSAFAACAREGKGYNIEYRLVRADGAVRWVQDIGNVVRGDEGEPERTVGMCMDITERKGAEEALRESESKHRTLLENLPQKIFCKDTELVYVSCNENFARDLKIRPEECAGKTDYDFFPEELAEKYRADDRTVIESGQTKDIEEKYVQDGKEIIVRTVKTPIRDAEGNTTGILGIFWDITARKRAEAELNNLSAEQAVLLNTVPAMIFWTDRQGQLIRANQAFAAALHKTPAEVEGRPLSELYPSEMADKFLRDNQEIIQSGTPEKRIEEAVATPSGLMWVSTDKVPYKNERGDIVGIIGFSIDITERKKAEETVRQLTESLERRVAERTRELAQSEARYRAIYEAIPDAVFLYDSERREVVHANDAFCRMYGYAPDELKGRTLEAYWPVHPEDRARIRELSEILQTQPGPRHYPVHRRLRKDGSDFWAEITTTDTELHGRPLKLIITRDVTERRKAAAALRHSEERYRTLAESARDSIFIINPDMTVQYVNDFGAKQFRRTPEATIGTPLRRLLHPSSIEGLEKHLTSVLQTGQPVSVERTVRFAHAPDREVWLDTRLTPLRNDAGEVEAVMGVARDTTRRRQAEEALRESEERYRRVVEDQTEFICRFQEDGTVTFVNEALCRYFEAPAEQLLGRSFFPYVHEGDRGAVEGQLASLTPERPSATIEDRVVLRNGEARWTQWTNRRIFDEQGNFLEFQAVGRDITRERQAESALRRTQREQAAILNSMTEHVIYHNRDMVIVWANRSACDSIGLTPQQIAGKNCYELWQGRSRPCDGCPVKRTLETGGPHEEEIATPEGRQWLVRSSPVQDENGGLVGVVEITMDITERTRAEEALRDSEERYRAVFEQATDSVVLLDAESGALVEFNDSACRNLGYTRDEFSRLTLADIDVIESPEEAAQHLAKVVRQGHDIFETKQRRKDGDIRDVQVNTRRISVRGKNSVHAIWRDITEQKRAQEALRQSEERYRTIYEVIPDAVFLYDPATTKLVSANDVMLELYGYTSEQIEAGEVSVLDLPPKSRREAVRKEMEAAMETPVPERLGVRPGVKRDGTPFWVDATSAPIQFAGQRLRMAILRDVTEAVRAREQIERQAQILANVTDAVTVADNDRAVTYWNRGAQELSGYSQDEVLGRTGLEFLLRDPGQTAQINERIESAVKEQRVWSHARLPCRRKSGEDIWVNVRASALKPGPGEAEGVLFVARDVTASVLLEQRLILTQRMATIGTLALSVSHELNNMLGGLRGLSDLAGADASLAPRLIDACRAVAERGGVIAGRMTSLSRADSPGQERQIDVASVAGTVVGMMGPSLAPRHIGVAESYQAVPPTWINEGQILQVLLNLITNARDSIGSDGRVDISVRHDADQSRIVISVHDSGAGIRAEDLPRVFDPFFTTKLGPGPGGEEPLHLGLGLPESRTIVRECGGTIDVESRPGQGATFTVRLPVRAVPTAPPRLSPAAQAMPERGTSILVVDDDNLMRFWLTVHLGDLGYNVAEASTGQAAAHACRDAAFPYVFLDLLMPGEMDGAATLRTLKEVQPDAKIIIITALTRANIPKDCLAAAHAVLKKPFGVDDLPAAFAGESSE